MGCLVEKRRSPINPIRDVRTFLNHKVLGLVWKNCRDCFKDQIKLNLSPKKRGTYTGPNIEKTKLLDKIPKVIPKPMLLSQVNRIHNRSVRSDNSNYNQSQTLNKRFMEEKVGLGRTYCRGR